MKNNFAGDAETNAPGPSSCPCRSVAFHPVNMTASRLKLLVESMPGKVLPLAVVEVEDVYETRFGDGYYSYQYRAFFSFAAAQRCAAWITKISKCALSFPGYNGTARLVNVELDSAGEFRRWHEGSLLDYINGTDLGWVSLVETFCGKDDTEPDFGDVAPEPQAIASELPYLTLRFVNSVTGETQVLELAPGKQSTEAIDALVDEGLGGALRDGLQAVPPSSPAHIMAGRLLMALEVHAGEYAKAAALGESMQQAGNGSDSLLLNIALAHHYAGKPEEAYRLLSESTVPKHEYQRACCASRCGLHSAALKHLYNALVESPSGDVLRMTIDEDLAPMWGHLVSNQGSFADYALLCRPAFTRPLSEVGSAAGASEFLDHFDYRRLPERLRGAVVARVTRMVFTPRLASHPGFDPLLAAELDQFRSETTKERRSIAILSRKVAELVGASFGEMVEAAARGEMQAARWRLTRLVESFPHTAADIADYCETPQLRSLAAEFAAVHSRRPLMISDLEEARARGDASKMLEHLGSVPAALLPLGVVQMYNGHAALLSGDKEAALQAFLAAARCWPDDVAPFHNAARVLGDLGRWSEALRLIKGAPKTFSEIAPCRELISWIEKQQPAQP